MPIGTVMATKITAKGQVTIPKRVREALLLSPGDSVEFTSNGRGEVIVKRAEPSLPPKRRTRLVHPRIEAQRRRRAAELVALLRGLD